LYFFAGRGAICDGVGIISSEGGKGETRKKPSESVHSRKKRKELRSPKKPHASRRDERAMLAGEKIRDGKRGGESLRSAYNLGEKTRLNANDPGICLGTRERKMGKGRLAEEGFILDSQCRLLGQDYTHLTE